MAEFYQRMRGLAWNRDYLTPAQAKQLVEAAWEASRAAGADPRTQPQGHLDSPDGVWWLGAAHGAVGGYWIRLRPRTREQIPPAELEKLEAEEPGSASADGT